MHVRENATGRRDGGNWTDACGSLAEAIAALGDGKDTVWVMGDWTRSSEVAPVAVAKDVVLVGGLKGAERTADDVDFTAPSVIDGQTDYNCLAINVAAGTTLTVKNFMFTRSLKSAFTKTGAGDLVVENCRFFDNGGHKTDTVRAMNGALYATGVSVWLENCSFLTNGIAANAYSEGGTAGILRQEGMMGSSACLDDCPSVTVKGCRVIGDRVVNHNAGGIFAVRGVSANVARTYTFENCLFAGCTAAPYNTAAASMTLVNSAPLVFMAKAANTGAATISLDCCTFAYNVNAGGPDSAGLLVVGASGAQYAATVRNSIFWGNLGSTWKPGHPTAADIRLSGAASLDMDYTLINSTESPYVIGEEGETLTFGAHLVKGTDPQFVTKTADFLGSLSRTGVTLPAYANQVIINKEVDFTKWNFHVCGRSYVDERTGETVAARRGKTSRAVDAGDPANGAWRNEPEPNGHRVNLGFYGGTANATTSPQGLRVFVR